MSWSRLSQNYRGRKSADDDLREALKRAVQLPHERESVARSLATVHRWNHVSDLSQCPNLISHRSCHDAHSLRRFSLRALPVAHLLATRERIIQALVCTSTFWAVDGGHSSRGGKKTQHLLTTRFIFSPAHRSSSVRRPTRVPIERVIPIHVWLLPTFFSSPLPPTAFQLPAQQPRHKY